MNELEVNCIQRSKPLATHHVITHLGHTGFACRIPVGLAIVQIRGKLNVFYTVDPITQNRIYIGVRREPGHCPYLQAHIDGQWTDHLLMLPETRPSFRVIRDGANTGTRQNVRFLQPR
ncbi:DUF3892 domain-containing protein [Xylophilus sp. Kf1]|nr:DUF3892 domain-containing protein [Xylophilus sp. Kf1]